MFSLFTSWVEFVCSPTLSVRFSVKELKWLRSFWTPRVLVDVLVFGAVNSRWLAGLKGLLHWQSWRWFPWIPRDLCQWWMCSRGQSKSAQSFGELWPFVPRTNSSQSLRWRPLGGMECWRETFVVYYLCCTRHYYSSPLTAYWLLHKRAVIARQLINSSWTVNVASS